MQLSSHFSLQEFTKTSAKGFDNTPNEKHIEYMKTLCENILEPVRRNFSLPVKINSGFRSVNLNHAMGGAPTSQHTMGQAADIEVLGVHNAEVWKYIVENLPFDQCIAEKLSATDPNAGWVHVSFSARNRRQALSFNGHEYLEGLHYVF